MQKKTIAGAALGAAFLSVFVASIVTAGPLDPPAGPIQSTEAVLLNQQDITLPYTISEPGLYRLTSDLVVPSFPVPRDGLWIAADNVTIDLNGFTLKNENGTGNGIAPAPPDSTVTYANLTIKNGTIDNWFSGVDSAVSSGLRTAILGDVHLESIVIRECGFGAELRSGARVERCRVFDNAAGGLLLTGDGLITDSDVYDNDTYNISVRTYVTVKGCRVQGGNGVGIRIEPGGNFCQILDNTVANCDGVGIDVTSGSDHTAYRNIITDCAAPGLTTGVGSDAPSAASSAGAGPFANIIR